MRCAVRAPTPGRMRKASTRRASAGVKPMASLEWQIHARRQIQTTGQLRHLFLALRVDALHGIVDVGSHQIFHQFAVILEYAWIDNDLVDIILYDHRILYKACSV